jgi:methionine-rich copper-binding protein CopC
MIFNATRNRIVRCELRPRCEDVRPVQTWVVRIPVRIDRFQKELLGSGLAIGAFVEGDTLISVTHRWRSALLLLFFTAGLTQLCWAHAVLMDSTPKISSTVNGPDVDINLRFNVRIDGGRSRVRLVEPGGTTSTIALSSQKSPNTLRTHAASLKPGSYKLQWRVLASDGHMSQGEIPFTVN